MQHPRSWDPRHPFPELCHSQKSMVRHSRAMSIPSSPFLLFVTYQKGDTEFIDVPPKIPTSSSPLGAVTPPVLSLPHTTCFSASLCLHLLWKT